MVQYAMKKKISVPQGVKKAGSAKIKRKAKLNMTRGVKAKPKHPGSTSQATTSKEISKIINVKNEEIIRGRLESTYRPANVKKGE